MFWSQGRWLSLSFILVFFCIQVECLFKVEVAGGCGGTFSVGVKKSKNGFISLQPMNDKGSYPLQPDCRVYIVVDPGVKVGLSKIYTDIDCEMGVRITYKRPGLTDGDLFDSADSCGKIVRPTLPEPLGFYESSKYTITVKSSGDSWRKSGFIFAFTTSNPERRKGNNVWPKLPSRIATVLKPAMESKETGASSRATTKTTTARTKTTTATAPTTAKSTYLPVTRKTQRDVRQMRRLVFQAEYNLRCSSVSDEVSRSALSTIADANYKQIAEICKTDCGIPDGSTPKMSCSNDLLTVVWDTNVTCGGEVTVIPTELRNTLQKRLKDKGSILYIFLLQHKPMVIYPNLWEGRASAKLRLIGFCKDDGIYDNDNDLCM